MAETLVSDAAVRKATGREWAQWYEWLDGQGARDCDHKAIVALLKDEVDSAWWRQQITGTYEHAVLGRERHEMPDGFQASASKTVAASADAVWRALDDSDWMPDGDLNVSTRREGKALRGEWNGAVEGYGRLDVMLTSKGVDKTLVQVNVRKLSDAEASQAAKAAWREALQNLKAKIEE